MELSRITVRILIVLMAVALGGILYFQYSLFRNNLEMKEEAFGRNAVSALNYAAERLEEIEVRERLFGEIGDSAGAVAVRIAPRHLAGSESGRDSVLIVSVVTTQTGGLSANLTGDRLSYELGTPQRVAVKVFDVLGKLDTTMLDERKDRGSHSILLPRERFPHGVFFIRVETDSATSTLRWNNAGGGLSYEVAGNEERSRRIVGRVAETVGTGARPGLGERLSPALVDSLIAEGLGRNGISLPYEYAVRDISCDSLIVGRPDAGIVRPDFQYSAMLFPLGFSGTPGELLLRFPDYRSHLLWALLPELVINLFLVGVVVACFWYAIRTLLRQKEFAGRLSDFINNMTHEFKTPLSTIALSTEAIARADVAADPERVETYNTIIADEQKRMKGQVDRILQMAALEEGELEFRLTDLDVHAIISRAAANTSLRVGERGGSLVTNLGAERPVVKGDAVHIENVIHNLLDNAEKYSPDAPRIEIATRNEGPFLTVSVSDGGIGIAPEHLGKVFEKYYRVPTRNIHDVKGFGLGLSYVKLVVERHGGKVSAASREGAGTTIACTIPVSDG